MNQSPTLIRDLTTLRDTTRIYIWIGTCVKWEGVERSPLGYASGTRYFFVQRKSKQALMADAFKDKVDCFGVPSNLNIFLVLELFLGVLIVTQKLSLSIRSPTLFLRFYVFTTMYRLLSRAPISLYSRSFPSSDKTSVSVLPFLHSFNPTFPCSWHICRS